VSLKQILIASILASILSLLLIFFLGPHLSAGIVAFILVFGDDILFMLLVAVGIVAIKKTKR